jgi:hypothetical protein
MAARRIAFIGFKTLLDRNSGASLELLTVLEGLAARGHQVSSMSFNCYDTGDAYKADLEISEKLDPAKSEDNLFHYDKNGIRHFLQVAASKDTKKISQTNFDRFRISVTNYIDTFLPDIVVFFGSNEMLPFLDYAKKKGSKIVFYVGTASYEAARRPLFELADAIVTPSDFINTLYQDRFGTSSTVIPTILPFELPKIDVMQKTKRMNDGFITLVNPAVDKGGHIFFAIARDMADLNNRFLAVESRATARFWEDNGYKISKIENLFWAPFQSNISTILKASSILIMPSLCDEAAGKVISEAHAYGVPTISYDVGGIAQQSGSAGYVIPLSSHLRSDPVKHKYHIVVEQADTNIWASTIKGLLENPERYSQAVAASLENAKRFSAASILPQWENGPFK